MVEEPPTWLAARAQQEAERYVVIGEDIVAPLVASRERPGAWLVLTCITRGGVSDIARDRRKRLRAECATTLRLARGRDLSAEADVSHSGPERTSTGARRRSSHPAMQAVGRRLDAGWLQWRWAPRTSR